MLTLRVLSLALFLLSARTDTDAGWGIDPNGCHRGLTTQAGGEMDPNGGPVSDYSACVDPNGACRAR